MSLKISYKDNYDGSTFLETKDFINHYIFRNKCWACHFLDMEAIIVDFPYGLCMGHVNKHFCRLYTEGKHMNHFLKCPSFHEQLEEEYIPMVQLGNGYLILL